MINSKSFIKLKRNGLFVNSVIRYCVTFCIRNFSFLRICYLLFHIHKKEFTMRKKEFNMRKKDFMVRQKEFTMRQKEFTMRQKDFMVRQKNLQ